MTVTLVDEALAVGLGGKRALLHLAGVGTQTHGAALVGDLLLIGHDVDHGVLALGHELGGVGTLHTAGVAGKLADRDLHAKADAKVGHLAGTGAMGC